MATVFQNVSVSLFCQCTIVKFSCVWGRNPVLVDAGDSLDVDVGADDVLNFFRVGILECEGAGPHPDPLTRFGAESKHDRQDLAFHFHHLLTCVAVQTVSQVIIKKKKTILKMQRGPRPTLTRTKKFTV